MFLWHILIRPEYLDFSLSLIHTHTYTHTHTHTLSLLLSGTPKYCRLMLNISFPCYRISHSFMELWFILLANGIKIKIQAVGGLIVLEWVSDSGSVISDFASPGTIYPAKLLCPWNSPGKTTGGGCHFLLQGIFPTQESNTSLLHWKQILYQLSHQGSLAIGVFY